nr:MMPL family transporter [Haloferax larsenii]
MRRTVASRFSEVLVERSVPVIVLVLLLTAAVGAGAVLGTTPEQDIDQTGIDSEEQAALDRIQATYETDDTMVSQIVVKDTDTDVLSRESLLRSLRVQRELREDESINVTLQTKAGIVGIENVVATAAYAADRQAANAESNTGLQQSETRPVAPSLDEQIEALESRSPAEVATLVERVLDSGTTTPGRDPTRFLPSSYQSGTTDVDARVTFVFQSPETPGAGETPQEAYDAQVAIATVVDERFESAFVFGRGIVDSASSQAVGDSFVIITPIALVLVLLALSIAYRDLVDVVVSVFGIAILLVWVSGIQGWLGIPSSSILIAVPFLLVGLSIDYSLHVVMRYREARAGNNKDEQPTAAPRDPKSAMRVGMASVVVALATAAFTTGIGFFANYGSPLGSIRDFAVLSGTGIVAMFVVFAALVPALKLEVEKRLVRLGRPREKTAVGTEPGPLEGVLSRIAVVSRRAPLGILVVALLVASAGAYGATGLDTEFNQADFLPQDAPEWAKSLPEPFEPSETDVRSDLEYLSETFHPEGQNSEGQILIRGAVTSPDFLTAVDESSGRVNKGGTVALDARGKAMGQSPVSVLRSVAAENQTLATAIDDRDDDGDGLPDSNVSAVYDVLFDVAPERAATVLHRTESGSYASARMVVGVKSDATAQSVAGDVRTIATGIQSGAPVTAVATGGPVITAVAQNALFETLVTGFAVTIGVIFVFLVGLYWWRYRAPGLAFVFLVPVVLALAWLLGAMSVLDIPFNSETVVITSLAIGLGIDYTIHLGERFVDERSRASSLDDALSASLTGTGGALFGSALTTAAGFGVLALALSPPLRRFGIVTGLSIVFAFGACLTVLPSLLVLRERLVGEVIS